MARHPPRDDTGAAGPPRERPSHRRLHRLRPLCALAPRRPPRADLRAAAAAAVRRPAGGGGRWRDRHDRRSVGALQRAEPAGPRGARGERGLDPLAARAVPRLRRRRGRRADGQQPRLAGRVQPDRVPARRREALHGPVHARQGLGPGAAGSRAVVHRVQLHAPAGGRLRAPAPDDGRRAADGRRRPVGQHHGRPRADPPARWGRGGECRPGPRAGLQAPALAVGREVREERGWRVGLAGCCADDAVRVLPVLAQHGRPGRGDVSALVHGVPARGDRAARCCGDVCAGASRGAAGTGSRHHDADTRGGGGGVGGAAGCVGVRARAGAAGTGRVRRGGGRAPTRHAGSRAERGPPPGPPSRAAPLHRTARPGGWCPRAASTSTTSASPTRTRRSRSRSTAATGSSEPARRTPGSSSAPDPGRPPELRALQ